MAGYDGQIDMEAFITDAREGVWAWNEYDITFTNGVVRDGRGYMGGYHIDIMMLLPDGTCRTFFGFDQWPFAPMVYNESLWSVSDQANNTLELYSPSIEEDAKTANYAQYAARTTLELLYYKDGVFIMKGMQPFAYWGGEVSKGVYQDYCRIVGYITTDRATVDEYLSYISYKQFKEENPALFDKE